MRLVVSTVKKDETQTWFRFRFNRFTLRFVTIAVRFKSHSLKIKRRQLLPLFDSIREYVDINGAWQVVEVDDKDGEMVIVKIEK